MTSLSSSRSAYSSSTSGKAAPRPKTRTKSTSSGASSSGDSSGASTPPITAASNTTHAPHPPTTRALRLPRTAEPLFRESDDEPSQPSTQGPSPRHSTTDEHKDTVSDPPLHSPATTNPAAVIRPTSRPRPASSSSFSSSASSRSRSVDILAFIDAIADETAKQEQSLQQWQQTDTILQPRHSSAVPQQLSKAALSGRKAKSTASSGSHLRTLSLSSTDTAPASPYSTLSAAALSPTQSPSRKLFSASASTASSTLASSLSLPLSLSPSATSGTASGGGSSSADNTFSRVRDKMLHLTQTVQQQHAANSALQSQLASLQAQHEALQTSHRQQLTGKQATYTSHLQQQLSFIDQLIHDKAALTAQLNSRDEEREADERQWLRRWEESEAAAREEGKREREAWERKERDKREAWQRDERRRIKELTIKGMEGEVVRMTQLMRGKQAEAELACEQRVADVRADAQAQHAALLAQHRADRQRWLDEQEDEWRRRGEELRGEADERVRAERAEWEGRKAAWEDGKTAALTAQQAQYEAAFSQYRRSWEDRWAAMERERREEVEAAQRRADSGARRRGEEDEAWKAVWTAEQQAGARQRWAAREAEAEAAKRREVDDEVAHIVDRLTAEHAAALQAASQQHAQHTAALSHSHAAQCSQHLSTAQQAKGREGKLKERVGELEEEVAMCESRVRVKEREAAQSGERAAALQAELAALRDERAAREGDEREERRRAAEGERARWEEERQRLLDGQEREMGEWRQRVEAAVGKKDAVIAQLQTKVREREDRIASLEGLIRSQQEELLSVVA